MKETKKQKKNSSDSLVLIYQVSVNKQGSLMPSGGQGFEIAALPPKHQEGLSCWMVGLTG